MPERKAYVCPKCSEKEGAVPTRVFVMPGEPEPPRCPYHSIKMTRQVNRPYVHKVRTK